MKNKNEKLELESCITALSREELIEANGGGLAYDIGFFLREMGIFARYGGGAGVIAASMDFAAYYRPL